MIGIGAGQQSRIHCTRLAGDKANNWSVLCYISDADFHIQHIWFLTDAFQRGYLNNVQCMTYVKQETTKDGMAGLQREFQNLNAKVN